MKRPHEGSSSDDEIIISKVDGVDCSERQLANNSGIILEQDRFLPIANISRIMKKVLCTEAKLSKEAKECIQEAMTEFLLFITSEASERCQEERRKTITGEDLLEAFRTLGFDNYIIPLETFMKKYREANKIHINTHQQQRQESSQSSAVQNNSGGGGKKTEPENEEAPNGSSLQPMQMFYDSVKKQYYVTAQRGDGTQSLVQVNLTPIGNVYPHPAATQNMKIEGK